MDRQNRQDVLFRPFILPTLPIDGNKAPGLALQVYEFSQPNTRQRTQGFCISSFYPVYPAHPREQWTALTLRD